MAFVEAGSSAGNNKMELPPQDFQANIVDYYENMRDTHWIPRFTQLSVDLAARLLAVRASCTNQSVDRWPEAQLTLLSTSCQSLITFYLLKHLLATALPLDSVFQSPHEPPLPHSPTNCLETWPQVQQHFAKLRSLILNLKQATPPPPPPPAQIQLPQTLLNPLALQPLLLLNQPANPFSLLPTTPLIMPPPPPPPTMTGNLLVDMLTLQNAAAAAAAAAMKISPASTNQLLPSAVQFPTLMPSGGCDGSGGIEVGLGNLVSQSQHQEKTCFSHIQVVCFKDEAKTRFMCSKCSKQWTSMKGAITFVVIMSHQTTAFSDLVVPLPPSSDRPNGGGGGGGGGGRLVLHLRPGANVLLELFPQACSDCAARGESRLSPPKWYPEEIDKVLRNLFVNIHRTFYKNVIFWEHQFDRRRRPGHPTGRHDSTRCLACQNGMCVSAVSQTFFSQSAPGVSSGDECKSQSECSPACKRRLVPKATNENEPDQLG